MIGNREIKILCLFFFLVSEEVQSYFLSFKQPKTTVQPEDGESHLNTVWASYFQAEFENRTKQNSVLVLEDHLLNAVTDTNFFSVTLEIDKIGSYRGLI